jgi:hypothetical protein
MADRDPRKPASAASAPCDHPAPGASQPPPNPVEMAPAEQAPAEQALAPDGLPMLVIDPAPPAFDINGFDPSEFEWRPVPRRPRADGWTPDVQRAFIQALADTGLVEQAARSVNMSVQSAYRLRTAPGSESFARAWVAALAGAADRVLDLAFARAVEGEETPVFDRDGCRVGSRWRTNDRLTMFILRAYMPDRFRHAHESVRQPGEAPPPALPAIADALAALAPVTPAEPHRLMPPERLDALVDGARAMADYYADLSGDDERARYVLPRVEADHPAASARAHDRRMRARAPTRDDPWDDDEN